MDAQAWRIAELVVEACGLIDRADGTHPSGPAAHDLEHLRHLLVVLSRETADAESSDAACSVVADIDRALTTLDAHRTDRAA